MKLIIVRHGEAEHNIQRLLVGHGNSRLTETGKAQVEQVAEKLRAEHIDVAFSSDSERALHTAQGILRFHPDAPLTVTEELRERNMGDLEGSSREEFIVAARASGVKWFEHKPTGGESMLETQQRVKIFIERIRTEYKGKTVLIASHGGLIRALLAYLLNHNFEHDPPVRVANTAVTVVQMQDDEKHIARIINDVSHLEESGVEFTK